MVSLPDCTEYVVFRNDEHSNVVFYLAHGGLFVVDFHDAQQMTKLACFSYINSLPSPDFHGVAYVGLGYPLFVLPSQQILERLEAGSPDNETGHAWREDHGGLTYDGWE